MGALSLWVCLYLCALLWCGVVWFLGLVWFGVWVRGGDVWGVRGCKGGEVSWGKEGVR